MSALEERQKELYRLIKNNGSVKVSDMPSQFSVSAQTIRKDLTALENRGLIRRTHGYAEIPDDYTTVRMTHFESRQNLNLAAKQLIAREAVKHIEEGDSIILGAGTTTLEIAKLLVERRSLTIFTNSLPVTTLFNISRVTVNLIGGIYVSENYSTHGPDTENFLHNIRVSKAFISSSGVRNDHGLACSNSLDASLNRAMIEASEKTYAVLDSTKFSKSDIYLSSGFEDLDYLITDSEITDPGISALLRQSGVEVIIAG
ncbi:MAG: DeoR/GlpR family DNA-binding transcription regulator [Bilifractor sp.]|jgi:DeoR/GlpR family transcriptional regulator of sugar metabolism